VAIDSMTSLHPMYKLVLAVVAPLQSCPWVGLIHGLGWVGLGRDFSVFGGLGWVQCSKSTKNLTGLCVVFGNTVMPAFLNCKYEISSVYKNTSLLNCKLHC